MWVNVSAFRVVNGGPAGGRGQWWKGQPAPARRPGFSPKGRLSRSGEAGSGAVLCGWARVRDQPGSVQQVVGAQKCVWGTALGEGHIEGVLHTYVK